MNQPTDEELDAKILKACQDCQQMLREVDLHWSGRPLVESVREAVDEIKRLRGEDDGHDYPALEMGPNPGQMHPIEFEGTPRGMGIKT